MIDPSIISNIIIALLGFLGTVVGGFIGVLTANKLVIYRIDQLEKRLEKFEGINERIAILEKDNVALWKRIDELKSLLRHHGRDEED